MNDANSRNRIIIRTSIVGIIANVFLASMKAVIGLLSNSIAVVLDAVNNLSDVLSSVVTIAGAKLAGKKPDKKHPLGHGRIEYLSAMLVSAIILYAGVTSAIESVKKIISPELPDYSAVSLIIIASAVAVKIVLGLYVKAQGKKAGSSALAASGTDALSDAVLSTSVLASAVIFLLTGVSLEAWVGVVISGFIIKAGFSMMLETADDLLGRRADPALSRQIKEILTDDSRVQGAYDLIINNYGPDRNYASVHLELPDTMTVDEVDTLTRSMQARVYKETGVILTGVGVYSYNTTDSENVRIRNAVQKQVLSHDWALQLHGFYLEADKKKMRFDVVTSFDIEPQEAVQVLQEEIRTLYPDYTVVIVHDVDLND